MRQSEQPEVSFSSTNCGRVFGGLVFSFDPSPVLASCPFVLLVRWRQQRGLFFIFAPLSVSPGAGFSVLVIILSSPRARRPSRSWKIPAVARLRSVLIVLPAGVPRSVLHPVVHLGRGVQLVPAPPTWSLLLPVSLSPAPASLPLSVSLPFSLPLLAISFSFTFPDLKMAIKSVSQRKYV